MFVNIPSTIAEIQQYFISIYTPIFSTSLVCACFKYEFMYFSIAIILNSFFRFTLSVQILAEFVLRLFEPFQSNFSIKFWSKLLTVLSILMEMVCLFMFQIF
jgi:hypothetical protein